MRHLAMLVFVLASACADSGNDQFPIQPGGGDVGGGGVSVLRGKVCLLLDPRFLDVCSVTGAGGLTVTGNGAVTTTSIDGSFEVPRPTTANTTLSVSGPNIMPSSMTLATETGLIPVVDTDLFDQMIQANGVQIADGTGSIIGAVATTSGLPAIGASAASMPAAAFGPFFDGATGFTTDATGERGVTWFAGVPAGPASVTFTDSASGGEATVAGVQVIDGGITFVDSTLP